MKYVVKPFVSVLKRLEATLTETRLPETQPSFLNDACVGEAEKVCREQCVCVCLCLCASIPLFYIPNRGQCNMILLRDSNFREEKRINNNFMAKNFNVKIYDILQW